MPYLVKNIIFNPSIALFGQTGERQLGIKLISSTVDNQKVA